jgi:hypothetical protein
MTESEYQRIQAHAPDLRGFCLASRRYDAANASRLAKQQHLQPFPPAWRASILWAEGADA